MITDRYDIVTTLLRYIRLKISFWPKKYIFGMLSKLITTFVASVRVLDFRNHLIDAKNNISSAPKSSFIFRNKVSYIYECVLAFGIFYRFLYNTPII